MTHEEFKLKHKYAHMQSTQIAYMQPVTEEYRNMMTDPKRYEPVSYDNWKLIRDLNYAASHGSYEAYCEMKEQQRLDVNKDFETKVAFVEYIIIPAIKPENLNALKEKLGKIASFAMSDHNKILVNDTMSIEI